MNHQPASLTREANIECVKKIYSSLGRGDIPHILGLVSPDVRWECAGREQDLPPFKPRNGPTGVAAFFQSLAETLTFDEFTPGEFYADGDKVFVLGHSVWRMLRSGKTASGHWMHVFTIKDGQIQALLEFNDTAQLAEAYRG